MSEWYIVDIETKIRRWGESMKKTWMRKIVAVLFAVVGTSVTIVGCKTSTKENDVTVVSNEKFKTSEEFIENEDLLYEVKLGMNCLEYSDYYKKKHKDISGMKIDVSVDGKKVEAIDVSSIDYIGFFKEGSHTITVEAEDIGTLSAKFVVKRIKTNRVAFEIKQEKKKWSISKDDSYHFLPDDDNSDIDLSSKIGNYLRIRNDKCISENYVKQDLQLGNLKVTIPYCPDMKSYEKSNGIGLYGIYDEYQVGEIEFIIRNEIPAYISDQNAEDGLKRLIEEGLLEDGYDEVENVNIFQVNGYPAAFGKYVIDWSNDWDTSHYLERYCGSNKMTVYVMALYCKEQLYVLEVDITMMTEELQDLIFQEILDSCEIVETDDSETDQTKASLNPAEESTEVISEMEETEGVFGGEDTEPETREETASSDAGDQTFIFPDSDAAYITDYELSGLSQDELRYAVNEIYARHHRKFKDSQLQAYFDSKPWYTGTVEPDDFDENTLNVYEKENVKVIRAYIEKIK